MDALIKTYYVPEFDTMDVWFGDVGYVTESVEVGDGIITKAGEKRGSDRSRDSGTFQD